ncbi:MAG: hypothetical protein KKA28_14185 [Planctomycetes bacterium]|nr:hypothetical protein [Planctomycetota bacterium]MCG2682341.1 hypothetical protein [Planctomycetales bacterium]
MKSVMCPAAVLMLPTILALAVFAGEPEKKYTLRYQYKPGETIRWRVEHRSKVRATVSGSTQTTETLSISMKAWRVSEVRPDGAATFEHRVEWVDMRQNLTGRSEVRYDSRTDEKPPAGFESAAKSVDVPLSVITMDVRGNIIGRRDIKPRPSVAPDKQTPDHDGWITIPLPEKPAPVGHTWTIPQNIDIPLPSGGVKRIKAVQKFTLEEVKTSVAVIRVSTDILTPISDPAIESQLIQRESAGRVWFDIDAGRVLRQQMETDKHVVGFRGDASSIHYVNRFSERIVTGPANSFSPP